MTLVRGGEWLPLNVAQEEVTEFQKFWIQQRHFGKISEYGHVTGES